MDPLHILYQDNCLVVINKPPGLLSQGDESGDDSAIEIVQRHLRDSGGSERPFVAPVHRLDRPVSGALILARKTKVASRLGQAFREGSIEKVYWALVEGRPAEPQARLEGWIAKDRSSNRSRLVRPNTPGAAPAVLSYRVLSSGGGRSLVEVRPETGRPHQIRVQLSSLGCPVLGDLRYGSRLKLGRMICLHCRALAFEHPVRREPMRVEAPPPEAWRSLFPIPRAPEAPC